MARKPSFLKAPFLKRVWLDVPVDFPTDRYPFSLPLWQGGDFELSFERAITIIAGENGVGKSTLIEGIAALIGFDDAGGGVGYRPVDHSRAVEKSGGELKAALKASWLPKVSTGWFFKAESFFSVARYLDEAALDAKEVPPDFLSLSHGEGFIRFFSERCLRRGIFIFDEPEVALSPTRQVEFLRLLGRIAQGGEGQVIIATHSPLLMACPGATLLRMTRGGLDEIEVQNTAHFRLLREFFLDPSLFLREHLEG